MTDIWHRHFADSLQLRKLKPNARRWLDLGTGAGFPGLVLAIDLVDDLTSNVCLVESNGKKCAFLREVIRETGAKATVIDSRIEAAMPKLIDQRFEIVTARALASLTTLIGFTDEMLKTGTTALFLKGQDVERELTEAAKCWILHYQLHCSETQPEARIVEITHATKREM